MSDTTPVAQTITVECIDGFVTEFRPDCSAGQCALGSITVNRKLIRGRVWTDGKGRCFFEPAKDRPGYKRAIQAELRKNS